MTNFSADRGPAGWPLGRADAFLADTRRGVYTCQRGTLTADRDPDACRRKPSKSTCSITHSARSGCSCSDGAVYEVQQPEMVLVLQREVIIALPKPGERFPRHTVYCDLLHVTRIEPINGQTPPTAEWSGE